MVQVTNSRAQNTISIIKVIGGVAILLILLSLIDSRAYMKFSESMSQSYVTVRGSVTSSIENDGFAMANRESDGFFDDIPEKDWLLMKDRVRNRMNHECAQTQFCPNYLEDMKNSPTSYYQDNWEPHFTCLNEMRIGRLGDGGKWVCDPHRITAKGSNCLIYSVGSNGDFSFEEHVQKEIHEDCEIHTFDMNPGYAAKAPKGVHYHAWGLSSETKGRFKSFDDTINELGHCGRTIDLFKIDCEGCEWDTFQSWLSPKVTLRQILVEVHNSPPDKTDQFFETLEEAGYLSFHKEPNIKFQFGSLAVEYAMIKLGEQFFDGLDLNKEGPFPLVSTTRHWTG